MEPESIPGMARRILAVQAQQRINQGCARTSSANVANTSMLVRDGVPAIAASTREAGLGDPHHAHKRTIMRPR